MHVDKKELEQLYIVERKTSKEIGILFGCSAEYILKMLKTAEIPRRHTQDYKGSNTDKKFSAEHKAKIGIANSIALKGKKRPERRTGKNVNCDGCNKEIYITKHQFEYKNHFCNAECHGVWRSKNNVGDAHPRFTSRITVQCSQCHIDLIRHKREENNKNFFCSKECQGIWKSENIRGAKVYNYFNGLNNDYGDNWNMQRTKALKRDNYSCQKCFKTKDQLMKNPDVHHVIPFKQFGLERFDEANEIENLKCLCPSCHKIVEEQQRKMRKLLSFLPIEMVNNSFKLQTCSLALEYQEN